MGQWTSAYRYVDSTYLLVLLAHRPVVSLLYNFIPFVNCLVVTGQGVETIMQIEDKRYAEVKRRSIKATRRSSNCMTGRCAQQQDMRRSDETIRQSNEMMQRGNTQNQIDILIYIETGL
jgi:hypothetical protein